MVKSKAVSPLVAAVLLIAVTMTIAGMLAYWASGFVRQQTETFSNQSTVTCTGANFRIYTCNYNSTNQQVKLILDNVGTVGIKNLTANVIYPDASIISVSLNGTLPSGGALKSFTVGGVTSGYSNIELKTECPALSVSTSCP